MRVRTARIIAFVCIGLVATETNADLDEDASLWRVEGAPDGARITLATFLGEMIPGLRSVAGDFEERTGIRLVVQSIPYASYALWVRTQILSREPPEVLLLEAALMEQYGTAGLLQGFDEMIGQPNPLRADHEKAWEEDFRFPLVQQARDARGRLWYLPFSQFGLGFFENRTLSESLGLTAPQTWEELMTNMQTIRESGRTAMMTAIRPDDAQTVWAAGMILEALMRPLTEKVNIDHEEGWAFDPMDRETTLRERISLEERVIAFERGLIDPARSPEFEETVRLMQAFSSHWRGDFLSLDVREVFQTFARGGVAYAMNGTWYFGTLLADLELLQEVAPESVFEYGTFPFPELTAESTDLPLAGGINQTAGMRSCFILPRQPTAEWREEAGRLLVHYLTVPSVARKVFANSQSWDIPALEEVDPRPEAEPLLPSSQYAFLPVADFIGYDDQALGEFWPLWQDFLGGRRTRGEFLQRLSQNHRRSLVRLVFSAGGEFDREFVRRELGRDFP